MSREGAGSSRVDPGNEAEGRAEARPALGRRLVRRAIHLWFRLSRGMTLGARAVVLDGAGQVFLVRHSYVPGWHFPGGGVEVGQSLRDALAMELAEEGNIRLVGEPVLFGVYHNHIAAPRDHVALFIVREFEVSGPRAPDREIVECGFFPLDALPAATTAATRRRLGEVLGKTRASPVW